VVTGRLLSRATLLAVGVALLLGANAGATEHTVLVTSVRGPITPVIANHLSDAIAAAQAGGHQALIVELDTPGGLDTSMRDIVQDFLTAPLPVIVYVAPPGARSASAGAIMTFAAHVAVMAPGTNIGAATPISMEGGEVIDKVIEDAAAYVAAIAEERGRDIDFAVDTVREGRSASYSEAVEIGAVDFIAASRGELLDAVDGLVLTLAPGDHEVELRTAGAAVAEYEMSGARRILQALADPNLAFLFLSLGTLAVLYELANPGAGLGGILGAIMLVLAFFSLAVLPTEIVGVLLLLLAVALFVAELFVPGVGVFAGGGAITLLLAGVFLFQRPTGIGVDLSVLLPLVVLAGLGAAFIGRIAWSSRHAPAYAGQGASLVGERGTVLSVDGDRLQVRVAGALWRAHSDADLSRGDAVRVVEMDGLELTVVPAERAVAPGD
jgi:membrane-bound serine protease (ClpP class)